MHELSVALEICRIAEERLGTGNAASLVTVGVEVGDQAGIEPDNLAFCLEALLASPPFGGARPEVVRLAGDVLCVSYLEVDDGRPAD
ncbi:MAG: hydrogenase maturation nickel metallochaperone HypA [Chloroflexota bacterium]|nr:hydrogenase maturation nickel metallochaperone HypA [Chloroflexota bacterium]